MVENQKGIHKGEAESYAQFKRVNAHFIISDDKLFTDALKQLDSGIRVYTTIHLICWLHKMQLIGDWEELIRQLHSLRPFTSRQLREAYLEIAYRFGIKENKKLLVKSAVSKKLSKSLYRAY